MTIVEGNHLPPGYTLHEGDAMGEAAALLGE